MQKTLLTLTFLFIFQLIYSQDKTVSFEDGTKLRYELLSTKAEDCRKKTIRFNYLPFDGAGLTVFEFELFEPNSYLLNVNAGFLGAGVGGIYFLSEKRKAKEQKILLKTKVGYGEKIKYTTTEKVDAKRYFGVHGGYEYKTYLFHNMSAHQLFVGFGMYTIRYLDLIIKDGKKHQKMIIQASSAFYFDALFFPVTGEPILDIFDGEAPSEDGMTNFGARLYVQPRIGFGKKNPFGMTYSFGVMTTPNKGFSIIFGGGVFWSFGE